MLGKLNVYKFVTNYIWTIWDALMYSVLPVCSSHSRLKKASQSTHQLISSSTSFMIFATTASALWIFIVFIAVFLLFSTEDVTGIKLSYFPICKLVWLILQMKSSRISILYMCFMMVTFGELRLSMVYVIHFVARPTMLYFPQFTKSLGRLVFW